MSQPNRIIIAIKGAEKAVADLHSARLVNPSPQQLAEDIECLTAAVYSLCTALRMLEELTTVDTIIVTGSGTWISLG